MYELLKDVLDTYVTTKIRLGGRARNVRSPDQIALLSEIPQRIQDHLTARREAHLFKVEGSIGDGNIANVPWVAIFRTSVTENARHGYYIVLLFSEDMQSCYLSLNQGVTAVEDLYTRAFARTKMSQAAAEARKLLDCHPEAVLAPIDLATSGIGRGYEAAAVESFRYERDHLPDDQVFFTHLDHLLRNYERLVHLFDRDLFSLFSVSEEEFQQVVLQKAVMEGATGVAVEAPTTVQLGTRGIVRSPAVAAGAIRAANFSCEVDQSHWTFTSRARGQRYVEAHHLIPISQQHRFDHTLDVTANIISLCATCHRMLHYAALPEKKAVLRSLLNSRRQQLLEKSISVRDADFFEFYGKSALNEE
jgi:5-methylcytosine-specific restriction protein A